MVSDALPSASPAAASAASARRTCTLDDDTTCTFTPVAWAGFDSHVLVSAFQLSANTVLSTMALNGQLNGLIRNKRLNQLFKRGKPQAGRTPYIQLSPIPSVA
jgi:hypothetical protein